VQVKVSELLTDVRSALERRAVPPAEAEVGARLCVDAELRGHSSHGVRLLRNVTAEYAAGADRRGELRVMTETPVSAQVDGGFHLSWYVHDHAVAIAETKARAAGIGMVSVRNAGVSGALGYLVERAAAQGLVCLALNSTPVMVVAPGTTVPSLGTNPLAVGVPRRGLPPLVLDMSTAGIAFNQVMRLRGLGSELPAGVALDSTGTGTIDPAQAIDAESGRARILPFGGHRGYGLALMVELLAAAGVSGRTAATKRGPVVLEPADFSAVYIAYQPGLLGDPEMTAASVEQLLADLSEQDARIPGEVSRLRREQCLQDGVVDIDPEADAILRALLN
jgi:LDH2 family malate/lactate/ureidoglycolate dehydrogenase